MASCLFSVFTTLCKNVDQYAEPVVTIVKYVVLEAPVTVPVILFHSTARAHWALTEV